MDSLLEPRAWQIAIAEHPVYTNSKPGPGGKVHCRQEQLAQYKLQQLRFRWLMANKDQIVQHGVTYK